MTGRDKSGRQILIDTQRKPAVTYLLHDASRGIGRKRTIYGCRTTWCLCSFRLATTRKQHRDESECSKSGHGHNFPHEAPSGVGG
jgi:hypothetical protein